MDGPNALQQLPNWCRSIARWNELHGIEFSWPELTHDAGCKEKSYIYTQIKVPSN